MAKPAQIDMFRTAYDGRIVDDGISFSEPTLTKQSFQDECDINKIVARFRSDGVVTHLNDRQPMYGDFASASDFHTALNRVIDAQNSFDALPADIRKRFGNDPRLFLEFALDPKNFDEMISLGLATRREEPKDGSSADAGPPGSPRAAAGEQAPKGPSGSKEPVSQPKE